MYAVDVVPNLPTPLMQTTVSLKPINVVSYYIIVCHSVKRLYLSLFKCISGAKNVP